MLKLGLQAIFLLLSFCAWSQKVDLYQVWPAQWITSNGPQKEYSVHYF